MAVKSYALTTRQRLIDFLGLSGLSSTQNTVLDRIIDTATEYIENYCDRRFQQTVYTNEVYDGDGSRYLMLKNYPVNSASTFTLSRRDSVGNEDDWSTIDTEDYFVHYNEGIVEYIKGLKFQNAPKRYRITYTAGFNFDNSSTFLADTEAGDVEYAMWRICSASWQRRKGDVGVISERLGDYSVEYSKGVFESPEIKEVLDKYARMNISGIRT